MKKTYYDGKELFVTQIGGVFSDELKKKGLFISEKELEICDPYVNPDCRTTWWEVVYKNTTGKTRYCYTCAMHPLYTDELFSINFISFEQLSIDYIKELSANMDDLEYEDAPIVQEFKGFNRKECKKHLLIYEMMGKYFIDKKGKKWEFPTRSEFPRLLLGTHDGMDVAIGAYRGQDSKQYFTIDTRGLGQKMYTKEEFLGMFGEY